MAKSHAEAPIEFAARRLNREDGPLYRQLSTALRLLIANGTYRVGAALPKEAQIADRTGVSLITVRQALRELEAEGLIRKRPAKPAVVTSRSRAPKLSSAFRNFADIASYTHGAHLEVVSYRRETIAAARDAFKLSKKEDCYCLRSILVVGGRRASQVRTYFPPRIGSLLSREDFDEVLIFRAVERHLGIRVEAAKITVRAEVADAATANDLDYKEGAPILAMEMLYHTPDQELVELSINRHRADLFNLVYDAPNDIS